MEANTLIWQIALPTPLRKLFDYQAVPDASPVPGVRVRVPFGKRQLTGFWVAESGQSSVPSSKLRPAIEVLDTEPLFSESQLKLLHWASAYYQHPLGEVYLSGLPAAIRQGKPLPEYNAPPVSAAVNAAHYESTAEQNNCIQTVSQHFGKFSAFLLEGVTGSGKTEVYCQLIAACLQRQEQALILVPEIALTPQTLSRFEARFGQAVLAFHSRLTDKQRLTAWQHCANGTFPIIIGTRSAIFLPFKKLGLIIVDEEHDAAFKQQEGFRYHGRDVALKRASLEAIPIVLGSATPSLESLYNAQQGKYQHLTLSERVGGGRLPNIILSDIRHKKLEGGLSAKCLKTIETHLESGAQVLLYLNRRGYAPCWMCYDCGWIAKCKRCDALLTYHHGLQQLWCHHCDGQRPSPKACPDCNSEALNPVGAGTQRIESVLAERFPETTLARIDSDATRKKGTLEEKLAQVTERKAQLIIGTQLLTKGHHFPGVSLVVIVDADSGLFSHDFKALERLGQAVVQVSGRAGRETQNGQVWIQSANPTHPLLNILLQEGYNAFANTLLKERLAAGLPPATYLSLFRAEASTQEKALQFLQTLQASSLMPERLLGPIPASMAKRKGKYRAQLLLLAEDRKQRHQLTYQLINQAQQRPDRHHVRWSVDIDPVDTF